MRGVRRRAGCGLALGLAGAIVMSGFAQEAMPTIRIDQRTCEPLLRADKPWEDFQIGSASVIRDGKDWHLWYQAYDHRYQTDADGYLCYAHSTDGVTWEKPNLGLVDYDGTRNNNILVAGPRMNGVAGPSVFLDAQAVPGERFKLVFLRATTTGEWWIYGGTSPDGIHWTLGDEPLLARNADTQNVCFRDGGLYRLYVRMWSKGPYQGRRLVGYSESDHFGGFPDPVAILAPDGQDPYDLNLYSSAATKLRDGLYVMFPSVYYSTAVGQSSNGTIAAQMAISTDGRTFAREHRDAVVDLGGGFDSKSIYVGPGAVPGDRPDTWWIYYVGLAKGHDDKLESQTQHLGGIGRFLLVEKAGEPSLQQVLLAIDDGSDGSARVLGAESNAPAMAPAGATTEAPQ